MVDVTLFLLPFSVCKSFFVFLVCKRFFTFFVCNYALASATSPSWALSSA